VQDALVYVAGAVRRPGLYRVRPGERVAAAITSAGGASDAADLNAVNLAARALDGDEIYVPVRGESPTRTPVRRYRANRREPGAVRSRAAGGAPPIAPASVDVNASDGATLERVPGIGRAIAGRIVEMRQLDGPFASTDELLDVAGMTQARLDRALPFLRPYP
jgi:competence protein ComEA